MIYLKASAKPILDKEQGLWHSGYIVFRTQKKRLTANILEKIRHYLASHVDKKFALMSLETLKTWFLTRYDSFTVENGMCRLETDGATAQLNLKYVRLIDIDR